MDGWMDGVSPFEAFPTHVLSTLQRSVGEVRGHTCFAVCPRVAERSSPCRHNAHVNDDWRSCTILHLPCLALPCLAPTNMHATKGSSSPPAAGSPPLPPSASHYAFDASREEFAFASRQSTSSESLSLDSDHASQCGRVGSQSRLRSQSLSQCKNTCTCIFQ
eukprot:363889-Chlamydomonas_euryale.AAC.7